MNNSYMKKLKFTLVFTSFIFLSILKLMAQPAEKIPFIKYVINNYSAISKAACDTCEPIVGTPLQRYRPIPLPLAAAANALPGVSVDVIPGLSAPNFFGGGSPEIKGLVKSIAGMTDRYAKTLRKTDILYFRNGAKGVAVSKSGKILTSSSTFLPGANFDAPLGPDMGFFSFKSTPAILPTFNDRSQETFNKSPETLMFKGNELPNPCKEVAYFAVDPNNDDIFYASLRNPDDHSQRLLVRGKPGGTWDLLDWAVDGVLKEDVWGALAVDKYGNLFIADPAKHVIVKATFENGIAKSWKILAGKLNTLGFNNGSSDQDTLFNKPSGICVDAAGNIYIGDAGNNVIRIIEADGNVKTYAGNKNGEAGSGDDGLLTSAKFSGPTAVAYNEVTKTLYVVDANNKTIREINKDKKTSTLAGNAISTSPEGIATALYYYLAKLNMDPDEHKFDDPTGIAIDPSGLGLYVSDGNYIKYVNSSEAIFTITAAIGDPNANIGPIPLLPLGLKMNSSNGSFYGVPVVSWKPTTYTISIINHVTAKSLLLVPVGFITFEVVDCPEKTDTVVINKTISRKELPYQWNGQTLNDAGTAAVTRTTLRGCDSVTVLNLTLLPELYYNSEPYVLGFGQPIKPIVPTTAGSKIETFSVAPPLPAGLLLNAQTGIITGAPTVYVPGQPVPAIGPRTAPQYPAPWTLVPERGADLTEVKISDGNGKVLFENNSAYGSLQGTAGLGTGTAGAYTDYSGLAPIKMYSNSPYSVRMGNSLKAPNGYSATLNEGFSYYNYMNSYAVYIDYNRDGDFADAGERVYISAGPQTNAHAEVFNLNIPASASAGVTKMRIYAVEAKTRLTSYMFYDPTKGLLDQYWWVDRTTEQALSFYPFFNDISNFNGSGEKDFHNDLDYGEFEDYNIDIVTPPTQGYVVNGSNTLGSAQYTVKLAVSRQSSSSTNVTICQNQLPYKWNNLVFTEAGTKTDTLKNIFAADSLATLNLTVNQPSPATFLTMAQCGPYNFHGQILTASNYYRADLKNVAGCDSSIYLTFRQKATASTTNLVLTPNDLPYTWNDKTFKTAGTQSDTLINNEGCDSIATLVLLVQYNIYYPTNNLLTLNKTITPLSPQIQGGYTPPGSGFNYSVSPGSPALPNGLQLNAVTGIISGTPTELSPLKTYLIKLNQEGAQPASFTLSVGAPSFSITTIDNCGPLNWNGVVYDKAGTFTATLKNQYGYDSTATLILSIRKLSASTTNLNLNLYQLPYNWNGDSITKEGPHIVHLVNAVGCDSSATADVVISPKIAYITSQILQQNQPIVSITPQNLGGKVLNYTIQPSLVKGLLFDGAAGIISGTPSDTLMQPVTYSVRAFNRAGADSAKIVLGVCNPAATSFTINTCNQYIWNDSNYTSSTTHVRTLKNKGGCDSVVTMHLTIRKATTGPTTTASACGSFVWYGVTYAETGMYTKVYTNAVGCDSTIYLNLTIKKLSYTYRYVNLNRSDLPYTWRGKTFTVPGTDTIMLKNSVGCDSIVSMTVRISDLLPDITYAISDTVLYWEKKIETPISMSNTGTVIPAAKLGETDTLINFSNNGPGDNLRNTVKGPDGAYYTTEYYSNNIYKLSSSGTWSVVANAGANIRGMVMDKAGNMYVGLYTIPREIKKITPAGMVSTLTVLPYSVGLDALAIDGDSSLNIISQNIDHKLTIVKFNLTTQQSVQKQMDISAYVGGYELQAKSDTKGNIYLYENGGNNLVKIKPDGQLSGIGRIWSNYYEYQPGNGIDAIIPSISSIAVDTTNDNVYVMAFGSILRVDTAENVTAFTGSRFDQSKDRVFRVNNGKIFIINNSTRVLFTANVHGVGSLPFMDNYGVNGVNNGTINYSDFDKRIRLDSSGAIVGTPRAQYSSIGTIYAYNTTTAYTILASNQFGISTAPMAITTKSIYYKRESFVTTTLPFVWRGRSYTAATDTARYFVGNKGEASDTIYLLHLVYDGPPMPVITSNCITGGVSLAANGAAKAAISFDGTNMGIIKNTDGSGGGQLGYYGITPYNNSNVLYNFHSSFEVWIKPTTVNGTQYLLTRDTVTSHGVFFGYSIQEGKFVYEFTKGANPFVDYKLSSVSNIEPNVWTHVAASFYDSTMYIFINGNLEGSYKTADRFITPLYPEAPGSSVGIFPDFYLAGLPGKSGYKGEMDELRLWSTIRNTDSIKADMNSLVNPQRPGLGLYYRFDGDVSAGVNDVSSSGRIATLVKPATSIATSGAPLNFASYKWMPKGETTKSVIANPASNTLYSVTVTDYRATSASNSLLVYPASGPTVTAPAAVTRTNTPSSCTVFISDVDLGSAIAVDNCPGVIVKRTGVPAGNLFPVGVTIITYTATNAGGLIKTATQTVTVTDNQKPVITSNGNQAVNNDKDVCGAAVTVSATAKDNCSVGTPTGVRSDGLALTAVYPVGTTTITWNVADANGNAAVPVTQTVTVTDNQKPVITSNGNQAVNNDKDVCGAAVPTSASATDNCTVGTPKGVRSDGLAIAAIYPLGTTTITWNVTDASGNAAVPVTQTVTVTDNQKPVITSNGNQAVNNDEDVCGAAVTVSATAKDNCSVGATSGVRSDGLALTEVYPVGTTTITWNVADAKGNAALPVIQTVIVTDNQKPTVLTKNITVTLVNGTASITTSQIDAGSKDNCGIKTISVSPSTFKCGNYGDNTVTLIVTDINGNVGSKTAIVTVKGVAPLPSIAASRTDNTFTGLDGKTIALGYGAQQLTLAASNTTSSANATTYKWTPATGLSSTNTATTVFKPTAAGTFVFNVTATNEFGCTASTTVTINVLEARCGNSNEKVLVCHKTGSSSNPTTQLCISPNAVATHLSSGDDLGMCNVAIASTKMEIATPTASAQGEIKGIETELTVFAAPNPTTNVFRLRITSKDQNTPATVRVLDAFGRSLNQFDKVAIGSTVTFGEGYINGFYFAEVFQGTQRKVVKLVKGK
jgi:hypothetical protein